MHKHTNYNVLGQATKSLNHKHGPCSVKSTEKLLCISPLFLIDSPGHVMATLMPKPTGLI